MVAERAREGGHLLHGQSWRRATSSCPEHALHLATPTGSIQAPTIALLMGSGVDQVNPTMRAVRVPPRKLLLCCARSTVLGAVAFVVAGIIVGVVVFVAVAVGLTAWARFAGDSRVLARIGGRDADPKERRPDSVTSWRA